jgi:uncharacterized cupredoxin-like copper-binding protein
MRRTAAALLVALTLTSAHGADWSNAQLVTVVATDYRFEPAVLRFRAKVPYRLHLENRGRDFHEFTAPAFFKAVELKDPDALNAERTQVPLQPGEQRDVYLVPREAGTYVLTCADHDWAGMSGQIVVE